MKMSYREMLRSVVMAAALLVILSFIIHFQLHAATTGGDGQKEGGQIEGKTAVSEFVAVEGKVTIRDDETTIDARERALDAARDEALMKAAGGDVDASILLREKPRLLRIFKPQRDSLIGEMKILAEEERPLRTFWVRITAKINRALLEDLLMKNLRDDSVIVVTMEKNMKQPLKRHILEHDLITRIKQKGYGIVDYRTIKNKTVDTLVASVRQGNTEAVRKLGRYYLTDLVVVGFVETKFSEKTQEIHSSYATGQVKIHRVGMRKELASLTRHDVKGFGSDEEKSGIDAIKKISRAMSDEAMNGLPGKPFRQVRLSLMQIDHHAAYQKAKTLLESLPAVQGLREGVQDFRKEEALLYVKTSLGLDELLRQIAGLKKFVVTKVDGAGIWLEARKMN
jgi:hypothetical protein